MIMAHANWEGLRRLVGALDHPDIDIYLHINSRSTSWDESFMDGATAMSKIYFAPRIAVGYCNYTQVEAQMSLLRTALPQEYEYYHLISGADLPLHNPDELLEFFEKNTGKEFVGIAGVYDTERAKRRFYFSNAIRSSSGLKRKILARTAKMLLAAQKILHIDHTRGFKGEIKKGADWWSITHSAATYVVEHEAEFKRYFKYTYCPSELLMQTLLYNSPFRNSINCADDGDEHHSALREIDWLRGQPYVWRTGDFEYLVKSPCMFARKFDANVDSEIITKIINHLHKQ